MIVPNPRSPDCLMPFMDERLALCLSELLPLLQEWRKWPVGVSETEGQYLPSECAFRRIIGYKVIRAIRAAAAASACTVMAPETEAAS